jgi:hypothetical protein
MFMDRITDDGLRMTDYGLRIMGEGNEMNSDY